MPIAGRLLTLSFPVPAEEFPAVFAVGLALAATLGFTFRTIETTLKLRHTVVALDELSPILEDWSNALRGAGLSETSHSLLLLPTLRAGSTLRPTLIFQASQHSAIQLSCWLHKRGRLFEPQFTSVIIDILDYIQLSDPNTFQARVLQGKLQKLITVAEQLYPTSEIILYLKEFLAQLRTFFISKE
jgi:hypothetical protein